MRLDALIYDIELANPIATESAYPLDPKIDYAEHWHDYDNMAISCICAYDFGLDLYHTYLNDNFDDFQDLVGRREYIIGYNSLGFDDNVCKANGVDVKTTYDLYHQIKIASGHKAQARIRGFKIGQVADANFDFGKTEDGANAPYLWIKNKIGRVVDYCLMDVQLTRKIFELGLSGKLISPTTKEYLQTADLFTAKNGGQQARLNL